MLQFSVPPGYRRTAPVRRPKLDEFTALIEQWLEDDRRHGYRASQGAAVCETERVCRKAIAAGLTQSGIDIEEMLALRAELTAMLKGNALYVNSHYEDE